MVEPLAGFRGEGVVRLPRVSFGTLTLPGAIIVESFWDSFIESLRDVKLIAWT